MQTFYTLTAKIFKIKCNSIMHLRNLYMYVLYDEVEECEVNFHHGLDFWIIN